MTVIIATAQSKFNLYYYHNSSRRVNIIIANRLIVRYNLGLLRNQIPNFRFGVNPMKYHQTCLWRGFAALLIVFVVIFVANLPRCHADDTKPDAPKWTPMFEGKTLDGWSVSKLEDDKKAEIQDGCIVLGRDDHATGLKYDKFPPKSNYEIMYQAKRVKGYDFFGTLTFPVKESHCSFVTGGWSGTVIGLSSINGYDASENETTGFYEFKDGQWYQFRVSVSDDRIMVWFYPVDKDGKTIEVAKDDPKAEAAAKEEIEKTKVDLVLDNKSISTRLEVTFYRPLGISTWNTEGHIRDIKYRELTQEEVERIKQLPERSWVD